MPQFTRTQKTVITGDVAVLVVLTIIGFATHLTLDAFGRLIVTVLGSVLAWVMIAPFFGVYEERAIETPGALWRVAWASMVAAPMATFLRGMVLNRDIPWVFILVTMLTSSFGLIAWRILYGWSFSRRRRVARDR